MTDCSPWAKCGNGGGCDALEEVRSILAGLHGGVDWQCQRGSEGMAGRLYVHPGSVGH